MSSGALFLRENIHHWGVMPVFRLRTCGIPVILGLLFTQSRTRAGRLERLQRLHMNDVHPRSHDSIHGLRGFLILDAAVRLFIWAASIAATTALITRLGWWPAHGLTGANLPEAGAWALAITKWVIVYNVIYVALLVLLRLPIPTPKEGRYELIPGRMPDVQLIWSCLIATLTKARFDAPFPAFLVFHAANLPPMSWMMSAVFGPRSKSCYVTDPRIIDPYMISIGRNVVIGLNAIIAAHYQEKDAVVIKRTVIEDDVIIGASVMLSGVHIKRGATIGAGAVVLPGSVVGENEYWAGNPARRRRKATHSHLEGESEASLEFEPTEAPHADDGATAMPETHPVSMA